MVHGFTQIDLMGSEANNTCSVPHHGDIQTSRHWFSHKSTESTQRLILPVQTRHHAMRVPRRLALFFLAHDERPLPGTKRLMLPWQPRHHARHSGAPKTLAFYNCTISSEWPTTSHLSHVCVPGHSVMHILVLVAALVFQWVTMNWDVVSDGMTCHVAYADVQDTLSV